MADDEDNGLHLLGDDKVVRPQFGDVRLIRDTAGDKICLHHYVSVRVHSRAVVCRVCNQQVDPFEILLDMMNDWERVTHHQRELATLAERTAELKREEANVKSRLRSAHKLGTPESRQTVVFDETMRRFGEACSYGALRDAEQFLASFKWLEPAQYKALADAAFAARQRAELAERVSPKRKRAVRVIKGGK
jgi:hypothetical protein